MNRRTLLGTAAISLTAAIAGCEGSSSDDAAEDEQENDEEEESEQPDVSAPSVSMAFEYNGASGQDIGVVTVTHGGGDNVDGATLTVEGDGITTVDGSQPDITASGANWAQTTGQSEVAAGDSVTVGVEAGTRIRVVWADPYEDDTSVLATFETPA